uniref:Uncharacterized protein n=1 Tax=Cacopsylla melanoneura TaxID=428564 RepID=A0A8D8VUH5_9HEMI
MDESNHITGSSPSGSPQNVSYTNFNHQLALENNQNSTSDATSNPLLVPEAQLQRLQNMTVASSDDYMELKQIKQHLNNCQLTPDVQEVINVLFWKLEAVLKERDDLIMAESLRGTLLLGQRQTTPNTHLLETLRRVNQATTPTPTGENPSQLFLRQELYTPTSEISSPTDEDAVGQEYVMTTPTKQKFMRYGTAPTPSSPPKNTLSLGHYKLTTPTAEHSFMRHDPPPTPTTAAQFNYLKLLGETLRTVKQTATPMPTVENPSTRTSELSSPKKSSVMIDNDLYIEEYKMPNPTEHSFDRNGPAPTPTSPTRKNLFLGHFQLTTPTADHPFFRQDPPPTPATPTTADQFFFDYDSEEILGEQEFWTYWTPHHACRRIQV